MASKYSVDAVIEEIEKIARVWVDNPTFTLGEVTLQNLQAKITDAKQKREQLEDLRMQLTALTDDLNNIISILAGIRTRALSGYRAVYGPNSTQYKQAGGTPTSEHRRPARKNGKNQKS
jgi:hypothetical protein